MYEIKSHRRKLRKPNAPPTPHRDPVSALRGTPQERKWFDELRSFLCLTHRDLLWNSLRHYAQVEGFPDEFPE
jgi:hypothetical protein